MNARKCVHAQKPYTCLTFAHESSKVRGRGKREEEKKRKGRETGKTEARRLMERKVAQQKKKKKHFKELKQGLRSHSSG